MCKECFLGVFLGFYKIKDYVNAKLDKTEMPMTLNEFKTEHYQWK